MMRYLASVGCSLLVALALHGKEPAPQNTAQEQRDFDCYERLTGLGQIQYVRDLGKAGKLAVLARIAKTDSFCASIAAQELCPKLSPAEAIAFCRTTKPGSYTWYAAMEGLCSHPQGEVGWYFREHVHDIDPSDRAFLYDVLGPKRWDDLAGYATLDLESNWLVVRPNLPLSNTILFTVAGSARGYLKLISKR